MKYGKHLALLIWIAVAATVTSKDVLKCMSCKKIRHIAACEEIELCDPDTQVCFVEEIVDIGGETVVNAGCRYKEQCDSIGCFGEAYKRRKRSYTGPLEHNKANIGDPGRDILCHHCCAGDFCNMYGCPDTFDVDQLLGSRCFSCEHVARPEDCNTIVNCDGGYTCGHDVLALGSEKVYDLGCMNKRKCSLLRMIHGNLSGRRKRGFVSIWSDCCDYHMCNGYNPIGREPPSMFSPSYVCPQRSEIHTPGPRSNSTSLPTTDPVTEEHENEETTNPTMSPLSQISTGTFEVTEMCEDKSSLCSIYKKEVICPKDALLEWTRQNCAKFCDLCDIEKTPPPKTTSSVASKATTTELKTTSITTTTTTTTTLPTTTLPPESACGNREPYTACSHYKMECTDPWMFDHCRGYCKMCLHEALCVDDTSNCEDYKEFICEDAEAKLECKSTCNLC